MNPALTEGQRQHAQDPKGTLFEGIFPILYSIEGWVKGGYMRQSRHSTLIANSFTPGGITEKNVLDIGCGYGTTTFAISSFFPASITAIDASAAMIEMMKFLIVEDGDIRNWLIAKNAVEILGSHYTKTLEYLDSFRRCFRQNSFWKTRSNRLRIINSGLFSFESSPLFDVIICNNALHWPINQLRKDIGEDKTDTNTCISTTLKRVASLLKGRGIFVMMEPKELTVFDTNNELEKSFSEFTGGNNPVLIKLNQIINQILREGYSIVREIPQNVAMFKVSEIEKLGHQAGLKLIHTTVIEEPSLVRSCDFYPIIVPINLGTVNLPQTEKVKIIQLAENKLKATLTDEEKTLPVQEQFFYFVFQAIS